MKVLYIRNLSVDVSEEYLRERFEEFGKIDRVKKIKDYGFVHFEERENCLQALNAMNGEVSTNRMYILALFTVSLLLVVVSLMTVILLINLLETYYRDDAFGCLMLEMLSLVYFFMRYTEFPFFITHHDDVDMCLVGVPF